MSEQVKTLEEVKAELLDAEIKMVDTLPESLAMLETTKEELEELREQFKDEEPYLLESAEKTFHIRKKLMYLLNDYNVFSQIDAGIKVLDKSIKFHTME